MYYPIDNKFLFTPSPLGSMLNGKSVREQLFYTGVQIEHDKDRNDRSRQH
ncbi:hypothetical protein PA598K_03054 [Paenibacillus sp. 598K]|nr:hypothetical protein PA598K_03054 [Paenibacillus sp. 598K]